MTAKMDKALVTYCIMNGYVFDRVEFYNDLETVDFYMWYCEHEGNHFIVEYNKETKQANIRR